MGTQMYHVTTKRRLRSILRHGLLCSKSRGKLKAVWLVRRAKIPWAMAHSAARHGVGLEGLVVLRVTIMGKYLRRAGRGLYNYRADVPPNSIRVGYICVQMES